MTGSGEATRKVGPFRFTRKGWYRAPDPPPSHGDLVFGSLAGMVAGYEVGYGLWEHQIFNLVSGLFLGGVLLWQVARAALNVRRARRIRNYLDKHIGKETGHGNETGDSDQPGDSAPDAAGEGNSAGSARVDGMADPTRHGHP